MRDLIAQEIDIYVYDDVCEELEIALRGPMELTAEGEKEFAEVLDYDITIYNLSRGGYQVVSVHVDGDDWKKKLRKAKKFFDSAAGYCDVNDYEKWFKEND